MGFFGTYEYTESGWSARDPEAGPSNQDFRLWIDIHDSDFATVSYAPSGPGTGVAYLGYTPRVYFDMEDASEPTDPVREALGLATWMTAVEPRVDVDSKQTTIVNFLASDDPPDEDVESEDDADVFVEIKAARLLAELRLPLPEDLANLEG